MAGGGRKHGAGKRALRPQNQSRFGEPTHALRVPVSKLPEVRRLLAQWEAEAQAKIAGGAGGGAGGGKKK